MATLQSLQTSLVLVRQVVVLFYTCRTFYDCLVHWTGAEPAENRSVATHLMHDGGPARSHLFTYWLPMTQAGCQFACWLPMTQAACWLPIYQLAAPTTQMPRRGPGAGRSSAGRSTRTTSGPPVSSSRSRSGGPLRWHPTAARLAPRCHC